MTDSLHHTPADTGDCIQVLGNRVTFPGAVDQPDLVMAEAAVPPGAGTPLHSHASPALFRILAGRLAISTLDGHGQLRRIVVAEAPKGVARVVAIARAHGIDIVEAPAAAA